VAVVAITGSSSGIGLAAALAFARRGDRVFACVRDMNKADNLMRLADSEQLDIKLIELDVTEPESFPSVLAGVVESARSLDVLVNNAGLLRPGAFEDMPELDFRRVMETNFFGPMLLTRAALPLMRRQGQGMIIMISSLSGVAGLAGDVSYSASKFALEGATEALRHEVDRWGIRMALVLGSQYQTGLFSNGGAEALPATESAYAPLIDYKIKQNASSLTTANKPEDLAKLLLEIADSDGSRLRWCADELAENVLRTLHAQNDFERDEFLQMAGDSRWWSACGDQPE
jgi:NAD(P)-dependent dehydrogenase (short-subunit alcohol dehydrogenase family)